jgi:hypothetical protein
MPKISSDFVEHRRKRNPFETYRSSSFGSRFQITSGRQIAVGGKILVDPVGKFENTLADAVFPDYVEIEPVFGALREKWAVAYCVNCFHGIWSELVPTKCPAIWQHVVTNYLEDIKELGSEPVQAMRQWRNRFVHAAEFIDRGQAYLYLPEGRAER